MRRAIWLVLVATTGAAAIAVARDDVPDTLSDGNSNAIAVEYQRDVWPIFEAKCIDCHDSRAKPPWYSAIPFAGDFVKRDIKWGRQRLDLSVPYPFVSSADAGPAAYLIGIRTALLDDSMPPTAYLLTHPTGALSRRERATILGWVERAIASTERSRDADTEAATLYELTRNLLRNRCARCHNADVDDEMNGEFDFVADLEFLVEDGEYVDPDDIDASPLFERIVAKDEPMPPSPNDALTPQEIAILRAWIEEGAIVP